MNIHSMYDDIDIDPAYKVFLNDLREDDKSYVFETVDGHQCYPMYIKYEQEQQSPYMTEQDGRLRTSEMENVSHKNKANHHRGPFCANVAHGASFSEDDTLEDESFKRFLGHLRVEGGFVLLDCEPIIYVKYEEMKTVWAISHDKQTENTLVPGELEMLWYEDNPEHGFSPVKEFEGNNRAIVTSIHLDPVQYKQKLLKVLCKPFDLNEYTKLSKEATERKPLIKQKHLRGMSKSYVTNIPGMSYFDHHPDLARQFEEADCYRGLALLRGFFFWLKNLCHEGSFKPWTSSDPEISATSGYELMLPLEDSPIDEIRDSPLDVAITRELPVAETIDDFVADG